MSERKQTIPAKDADFNLKQEIIAEKANTNIVAWRLDDSWMNGKFNPARNRWTLAWSNYLDENQRTPLITFEKNMARKEYEPCLRLLVKNLESNTFVTDDDRAAMGIFPPKPRKPVNRPTSYPSMFLKSSAIREITVDFRDSESVSRAKPQGVHGAEIRWAILDHKPAEIEELVNSDFDTRSPFSLEFKESERGRTVWFCMRWENTRGEKGPWSEFVNAIIP
jgi:hypothetical protein